MGNIKLLFFLLNAALIWGLQTALLKRHRGREDEEEEDTVRGVSVMWSVATSLAGGRPCP